jgi:hypothetical protein
MFPRRRISFRCRGHVFLRARVGCCVVRGVLMPGPSAPPKGSPLRSRNGLVVSWVGCSELGGCGAWRASRPSRSLDSEDFAREMALFASLRHLTIYRTNPPSNSLPAREGGQGTQPPNPAEVLSRVGREMGRPSR